MCPTLPKYWVSTKEGIQVVQRKHGLLVVLGQGVLGGVVAEADGGLETASHDGGGVLGLVLQLQVVLGIHFLGKHVVGAKRLQLDSGAGSAGNLLDLDVFAISGDLDIYPYTPIFRLPRAT